MGELPLFEAGLLRRDDRAGPCYTSDPTVPHFDPAFGEAELREFARRSHVRICPNGYAGTNA
jgi:hypothetical protein